MSELLRRLGKWIAEKTRNLFKEKPPPQQPCQIFIQADKLTAENLRVGISFGLPNSPPTAVVIQASPPKSPEHISDKKD